MYSCRKCGNQIPVERVEALDTAYCINCADGFQPDVMGFMVYDCKTNGEIAIIKKDNPENIRIAQRCNERAR